MEISEVKAALGKRVTFRGPAASYAGLIEGIFSIRQRSRI